MTLTPQEEVRTKWNLNRIMAFDIEAYDWTNPIAVGMANNRQNIYQHFTGENCIENFVNEILKRKWRNYRFVAHNGGKYDFIPIIEELVKQKKNKNLNLEILTKGPNETPFFVRIEDNAGKTRYLQDSFALMPRGLDSLTHSFVPDAPKLDFDLEKIDKWNDMTDENKREMLKYLKRDCTSLFDVLEQFTRTLLELTDNTCPPQLTIGSTAMTAYRSYFMDRDLSIPDCYDPDKKQDPESQFRKSYFGGRTEVYRKYGQDLYHYDVNSLYPYCYTRKPVPIGNVSHTGKHFPIDDEDMGGVLKIKGHVPENTNSYIPVLPYRYTNDEITQERVIFPCGDIDGWYMAKEVRYALEVGALEHFEIVDSYASKYGYPFEEYGERNYDLKNSIDKEVKPGKYKIVKFLLNSFYGKFGMDRFHSSVKIGDVTKEFQQGKEVINDELAELGIMIEEEESFAPYILPRIASAITAQARIEMHKWFRQVHDKGGKVWYCDTDSVVTDVELPEGEDMGEMDLEGVLEEGVFLAPKVYAEKYKEGWGDEMVKAKGMKDPEIDFYTYRKAYENNNPELIRASWESPMGFKAGMKQGESGWFEAQEQNRSLQQFDQKRRYDNDRSYPIEI